MPTFVLNQEQRLIDWNAGFDLVCVSALDLEHETARLRNLREHGFPIERVIATGNAPGERSPKADAIAALCPEAATSAGFVPTSAMDTLWLSPFRWSSRHAVIQRCSEAVSARETHSGARPMPPANVALPALWTVVSPFRAHLRV